MGRRGAGLPSLSAAPFLIETASCVAVGDRFPPSMVSVRVSRVYTCLRSRIAPSSKASRGRRHHRLVASVPQSALIAKELRGGGADRGVRIGPRSPSHSAALLPRLAPPSARPRRPSSLQWGAPTACCVYSYRATAAENLYCGQPCARLEKMIITSTATEQRLRRPVSGIALDYGLR